MHGDDATTTIMATLLGIHRIGKMKWRKRITLERARYVPKTICLRASIQRKH